MIDRSSIFCGRYIYHPWRRYSRVCYLNINGCLVNRDGIWCSWRLDSSSIWVVSCHCNAGFQETGWMRKLLPAAPLPVGSSLSSLSLALLPFEVWCAFLRHRCCCAFARVLFHVVLAVQLLVGAFWMSLLQSFAPSGFSLRVLVSFSVGFCFFLHFLAGALCVVTVASLWKSQSF